MENPPKVLGIIPARYASTRFPGKPLALIDHRPMIQWVYEAVVNTVDDLWVATDHPEILEAVISFGGKALMTSSELGSGTDRCHAAYIELADRLHFLPEIIINFQGDEPLIKPAQVEELVSCFSNKNVEIATLVTPMGKEDDPDDPNLVKVVVNQEGRALYFSRSAVPYISDGGEVSKGTYLKHIGIYAFRASLLEKITVLPFSSLEHYEKLEQLRWLEHGMEIYTAKTSFQSMGIDVPEDLEKLKARLR